MKTNKISKNVKTLILTGLIVSSASLVNISYANTPENNVTTENSTINIMSSGDEHVQIKEITREQYIENLAKNEGITIEAADKLAKEQTEKSLQEIRKLPEMKGKQVSEKSIVWRQASWVQTYSKNKSFKAEMDASFEVWTSGSFRQINSCSVGSSLAAGKYKASWSQSNSWKTTKFPVTTATVGVTGKFYSTVSAGADIGMNLGGFTISGTSSTSKTYASQNMTIQRDWSVY